MKRVLITGAGGAPSTNFVRSLRASDEPFYLIGSDCNPYHLQRAETDECHLIPTVEDPDYMAILYDIIDETKPDLIYSQPDQEILVLSENREHLRERGVRTFLPPHDAIVLCQDKYLSNRCWSEAGIRVPNSMRITGEGDLRKAFDEYGSPIWIRANYSPGGGRGAFKASSLREAKGWLDFCDGWDATFSAAQCLSPQSVTWMSLYKDGELIAAQGRTRVYWEFANRAPSGVTGITGAGITSSDSTVDELAQECVRAVADKPNGVFSVDFTYDRDGYPQPTEINIGRFFTTHHFFTRGGLNLPAMFVALAFDEPLPTLQRKINPLSDGLVWIRGMDVEPILTTVDQIELTNALLEKRRARVAAK